MHRRRLSESRIGDDSELELRDRPKRDDAFVCDRSRLLYRSIDQYLVVMLRMQIGMSTRAIDNLSQLQRT